MPNGILPTTERREYVAPTYTGITYAGFTSARQNMRVLSQGWYPSAHSTINNSGPGVDNNPMTLGQCTWFAWYWRAANGNPLPGGGTLGHARTLGFCSGGLWLPGRPYSRSWRRLQTTAGWYGHVGIVMSESMLTAQSWSAK